MKIYLASTTNECIDIATGLIDDSKFLTDKPCYVFCEDKITLNQESAIANKFGGFFGIEILPFKRYIKLNCNKSMISKEASIMIVRKIILQLKDNLKCFNAKSVKPNLALTIYEIISQLESAKITASDLFNINSDNKTLTLALKNKIQDISLIYDEYKKYLNKNDIFDSNDYLSLMPELIKKDEKLKDAQVMLVGFPSVTKQREEIFEALISATKDITAVVLADKNSEIYTNETLTKLLKIAPNSEVIVNKNSLNSEALFIKNNLYNVKVFSENFKSQKTDKIKIYEAVSTASETEFVAKQIASEVRNGKRYRDITVAVGDLEGYYSNIINVFDEYEIPYYIDKKSTLLDHPISNYILSYLDLVRKGFSVHDFMLFISSSIFCTDKSITDGLKNYVYKHALTRSLLKVPFENLEESEKQYENLRELAFNVYKLGEKAKTVNEHCNAVKSMLEITNAFSNLKFLGDSLINANEHKYADVNEKITDKVLGVLDEMQLVIGDTEISSLEFKNIFISGAMGTEIATIPLFNDGVFVGACKEAKTKNSDILFVMGLNGDIPYVKNDTALLNDSDLLKLDKLKLIVEPKIKIVNDREKENVGSALLAFKEKLILSFSEINNNGDNVLKSEIISYFEKMFDLKPIKEQSINAVNLNEIKDYSQLLNGFTTKRALLKEVSKLSIIYNDNDIYARSVLSSLYEAIEKTQKSELKEKIDSLLTPLTSEKHLDGLTENYFSGNKTSASALERYFECPYSGFVKNLLRLHDSETGEMRIYETGTLLHELTENYVKNISKVKDKESSNKLVEELIKEILSKEEYVKFLNKAQYRFTFKELEKEGKRVCYAIFNSIITSKFEPFLTEVAFNENSKYKPIKLNAKSGKYNLIGKVDRVDKYGNSIRIIDYKTGKINSSDESFYSGRKLQLYLYLNAFIGDGYVPVGTYYFPVHDKFMQSEEKNYIMRGKTIDDEDILVASDINIETAKKSENVSVKLKKDGKPNAYSETLTQEEMTKYLKYAIKVSEKAIDEMNSGFIKPSPYKDACTYCPYLGMCGFDKDRNKERQCKNVSKKTIISAVDNDKD